MNSNLTRKTIENQFLSVKISDIKFNVKIKNKYKKMKAHFNQTV